MREGISLLQKRTPILLPLSIGIIIVAIIAIVFFWGRKDKEASAGGGAAVKVASTPLFEVATAAAIMRGLDRSVEVVGTLAADEEVVVSAQTAGELSRLNIDFGSFVAQGQVIATIDQRDAGLKVEQAEAALKQTYARLGMKEGERFDPQQAAEVKLAKSSLDHANLELKRVTKLIENGDISRSSYDLALTNHSAAQARHQAALDSVNQQLALVLQQRSAISLAKKTWVDTIVKAPISGAVKEKHATRGSYLPINGKIVTIVKINPLRLRADIPEYAVASAKTGQIVNLSIDSFPNRTFTGRIVRIGPSLNEQTRALTVEAEVANPKNELRPGMFAKAQLITAKEAPAVMVPQKAILITAGISKVFVLENGKVAEKIVKTGIADGDLIEIIEGVSDGQIVATNNLDKLQSGIAVKSK